MRTDVVLHYHFVTLRIIADLSEPYSLGSMIKSMQDPAPNSAVLVGLGGLEPPTSRLSGVRSNHLSYRPEPLHGEVGGARRIRTDDPLRAKQVLSQLSYSPLCQSNLPLRRAPLPPDQIQQLINMYFERMRSWRTQPRKVVVSLQVLSTRGPGIMRSSETPKVGFVASDIVFMKQSITRPRRAVGTEIVL